MKIFLIVLYFIIALIVGRVGYNMDPTNFAEASDGFWFIIGAFWPIAIVAVIIYLIMKLCFYVIDKIYYSIRDKFDCPYRKTEQSKNS